jgi:putative lipoprotein
MQRCARYLLGTLALLITLGSLSSCGDKWQRKLSDKKLRQLIGELYKADCLMDNLGNSINDTMRLALEDQIFEKYGITRSDFDSIVYHYNIDKPLYFADIVRRASQDIDEELGSIQKGNPFSPEDFVLQPFFGDLNSHNIHQIVPESYYPRYVSFLSKASWLTHSAIINDGIPAGSSLEVTIDVEDLPEKVIENQLAPILEVSYYADDSHQVSIQTPLKNSNGETYCTLDFKEDFPPGRLTLSLFQPGGKGFPAYTLYIRSLRVAFISGKGPDDSSSTIEDELLFDRLLASEEALNPQLRPEP